MSRSPVAFVVQRYGPDAPGGSEALARALAERLSAFHEVTVFTTCARDYVTWRNELAAGESEEDAVKAPVGALFRDGPGWAAFVLEGERARKRAVKLARRNNLEAMIEDGLKPAERVVVYPSDALKDGSRVEAASSR